MGGKKTGGGVDEEGDINGKRESVYEEFKSKLISAIGINV